MIHIQWYAGHAIATLDGRAWVASNGTVRSKYPLYGGNKRATKRKLKQSLRDRGY